MLTYEQKKRLKLEVEKTIDIIKFNEEMKNNYLLALLDQEFKEFDTLYPMATEDIASYYQKYNSPKTFLTVGGSGDQLLNAVDIGATKIDVFDMNVLSKRGIALKIACAKMFTVDELLDFFITFDEEKYKHISSNLSEMDVIYWDSVYDFVGEEGIRLLFGHIKVDRDLAKNINPYLEEKRYNELVKKLKNVEINYIDSSLYDLDKVLGDNTYDGMTFSNIYEYLNTGTKVSIEKAQNFHQFIMEKMYPRLNKNGMMMLSYQYAFSDKVKEQFEKMQKQYPNQLITGGAITFDQVERFIDGYNDQIYAYSLLMDEFKDDSIIKVPTNHVIFGQSGDKSHDMAVCLRK